MKLGGFDCTDCRIQFEEAKRPDAVPCDTGECPYKPSPGDIGPDGCGLAPENQSVVQFYPKWKVLGDAAFHLIDLEFSSDHEADVFATKLMMIEEMAPLINEKRQNVQEAREKSKKQGRR